MRNRHYQGRTYKSWAAMWTRVRNPNRKDWNRYGGRGIYVCKRWQKFENFLEDMGIRPKGKTLDRRDSNGNYTPLNCRWASPYEQVQGRLKGFFRGEKNNQARLTAKKVKAIRKSWDHTYALIRRLSIKYKVSFGCISKIVYGQTWQD